MGVIEPMLRSDWTAPIVPVMKADGKTVRTCRDFRFIPNLSEQADWYPLPSTEDLFLVLAESKLLSKTNHTDTYL